MSTKEDKTIKERVLKEADTNIIFYAFRYALGRHTGAVGEVVSYILNHWKQIPDKDKVQMAREIESYKDQHGNLDQIEEWIRIVDKANSLSPDNSLKDKNEK